MDADTLRQKLNPEQESIFEQERKKKKYGLIIQVVVTTVIILLVFAIWAIYKSPKPIDGPPRACFKHDICIDLVVMTTQEELEMGLSNYSSWPDGKGMLFIFSDVGIQRMWMKDMDFPIDMFWIDSKNKIRHIEKKALPCIPPMTVCEVFEPNVNAKYVLETNEGFAIAGNLFDGDTVTFENIPKI